MLVRSRARSSQVSTSSASCVPGPGRRDWCRPPSGAASERRGPAVGVGHRGGPDDARELAASVRAGEPGRVAFHAAASSSRATVAAVTCGMSTASTTTRSCPPARAATPAASPASGPPPGGSSRAKRTGTQRRRLRPDHDDLVGARDRGQSPVEQRAAGVLEGRLVGSAQPRAVPTGQDHRRPRHRAIVGHRRGWWQAGAMQVVLVQESSSLDPADNRARLGSVVPEGADLVVLPEAFARDFGEPGSDLAPFAEPLDGPFVTEVERVAAARDTTVVAGMFEQSAHGRRRPSTRSWCAGAAHLDYRKIHLYDSFGYRESDVLAAGPDRAGDVRPRRHDGRRDDLLRPALPRARPAAGRRRCGGHPRAVGLGGRAAQGRPLDDAAAGARHREHRLRRRASASPAPATAVTRWWSDRSATSSSRPVTTPRS